VWSGWAGIAQKTGFGLVSPAARDLALAAPGHRHHPPGQRREVDTAYTLRAWRDQPISPQTIRLAKWSAICFFTLGMARQVVTSHGFFRAK
jgi:hypothetical protein